MQWNWSGRAARAPLSMLSAALCALTLTACNTANSPMASAGSPRGATVAFDSIDGLPPGQFQQLVEHLNTEAQSRRLAVTSRENQSAYRVRGYLTAKVSRKQTTIGWVWDVFNGDDRRALRIAGEETANSRTSGRQRDAWVAADSEMMQRIAHASMDQLSAFLTSVEVAPGTPDTEPRLVLAGMRDNSPEGSGIFRIFQPDPAPAVAPEATGSSGPVPLPRRRPALSAALTARESLQMAASGH